MQETLPTDDHSCKRYFVTLNHYMFQDEVIYYAVADDGTAWEWNGKWTQIPSLPNRE